MNFRDYDRKFWLAVEKDNKKTTDLIGGCDGNAILCYSYFNNKDGIVYTPLSSAVYANGDYSITKQGRMSWQYGKSYLFAKKQFDDYQMISINNKALSVLFEEDIKRIEQDFYSFFKDLVLTRDIRFIDEFRSEDDPDVLKCSIYNLEFIENGWMKINHLIQKFEDNIYIFLCELISEPFFTKEIRKGDKRICFVKREADKKVCKCFTDTYDIQDLRKRLEINK